MLDDLMQFSFLQHAFLSAILVSIAVGIIGSLIVVNRMVFLAGGIAHSAFGGIGIALFFNLPLLATTSVFSIFIAIILTYLILYQKQKVDSYIGVIWAGGMALGLILGDLSPGYHIDMMSYLFGSILSVSIEDLYFMFILDIFIIGIVMIFYPIFLSLSYDLSFAKLRGIRVGLYYLILMILTALTIIVAIRAVGLILVMALLTIPTYMGEALSRSLSKMMIISSLLALLFSFIGLVVSYYFDISSGASIIAVSVISFILFHIAQRIKL